MSSSCAPDPAAAVKTLQELSEFRGTSITKSAVFNAIELVNMFDADEVVTAAGCHALRQLAYFGEAPVACQWICELGGLDQILRSMDAFPDSKDVQLHACAGLGFLAYNGGPEVAAYVRSSGAPERIRRARAADLGKIFAGSALKWMGEEP